MHTNVHSSVIHNHHKVEATQIFIKWWMDKQNVAYLYNRVYSAIKSNEILKHATTWMNLEMIMPSEEARHKGHILWDSIDMNYLGQVNP